MRSLIKKVLPISGFEAINRISQMKSWWQRGYLENAPQGVKTNVLKKYGVPQAPWIETGTYYGTTTYFLSKSYPFVYSIEPEKKLYEQALRRFDNYNVKLFNGVSEVVLPGLLPTLTGDINFWLDGHYSAGVTFKGDKDCPVEDELLAISKNIDNFSKVAILIDDVRCFLPATNEYADYPSIDNLVDWARSHNFNWRIEHDIFIARNFI